MEEQFVYLGLLAGSLTSISFIPQAWRVYRTKSAEDLSMPMFMIFSTGVLLWFTYGIMINNLPIIVTNAVTLSLCLSIIVMKFKYRSPKTKD